MRTPKEEGVIEYLSAQARSQELEQIGHEEEGLKVLQALEAEGWMKVSFLPGPRPKADEEGLTALHDLAVELLVQGVHADMSAAQMRLLTARLAPKELAALKKLMLRPGFVEEWNSLDALAAGFAKVAAPRRTPPPRPATSCSRTMIRKQFSGLDLPARMPAVKDRFNLFLKVWPEFASAFPTLSCRRCALPPNCPRTARSCSPSFLELLDGKLATPEEAAPSSNLILRLLRRPRSASSGRAPSAEPKPS
jgi:tRNA nucleotidyltransferase (CCA-adding enzyme)